MAESPAAWKSAELVVKEALDEYDSRPLDFCGLSQPATVCEALRRSGHLKDQDEPERGGEAVWGPRRAAPEPPNPAVQTVLGMLEAAPGANVQEKARNIIGTWESGEQADYGDTDGGPH